MISEVTFASTFSSFWRELLPAADAYVRRRNLALERFSQPVRSSDLLFRDAINELGFRLFCLGVETGATEPLSLSDSVIAETARQTMRYIGRFRAVPGDAAGMPRAATDEALFLARRIGFFVAPLRAKHQPFVCRPKFAGCGMVDACEGDLSWGSTLCEVKSGDRLFRSSDLRQLLTYCALRYGEGRREIARITLVNPRRGVHFSDSLEGLCRETSGLSPSEVMLEIVEVLSESESSR